MGSWGYSIPRNFFTKFWHEHEVSQLPFSQGSCSECDNETPISFSQRYKWHMLREVELHTQEEFLPLYDCNQCQLSWHPSCVPISPEKINHPCHPNHPLELLLQGPPSYSSGKCNLCQGLLAKFIYHCKLCDFSIDVSCTNDFPRLTMDHPKCHDHALTLMGREVSFTCNACGTRGEQNPYVCVSCSLMFHYECVDRPHIININRHDHRISHTCLFSPGDRICEVCRQDINWKYGAYSCNKCPTFFVHSKCATRDDVWDGVELEGIPEEEVVTAPFKVIDGGIIDHFSHEEHNLLLIEDGIIDGSGESIYCEGCCRPISFERYYTCMECVFMLHEECANLPLQKRHALSTRVLLLSTSNKVDRMLSKGYGCRRLINGFSYSESGGYPVLDVLCASLFWFRHRKLHPHTLFLTTLDKGDCVGCDETDTYGLSCVECEYFLDFKCATLPVVIKHRCDDHYLFLSSGEKATGKYWCEICEAETDPSKWFYTCNDCGVVCHIDCVFGDSLNLKPGLLRMFQSSKLEAILNNQMSRPLCSGCGCLCTAPIVYKTSKIGGGDYNCTYKCLMESTVPTGF